MGIRAWTLRLKGAAGGVRHVAHVIRAVKILTIPATTPSQIPIRQIRHTREHSSEVNSRGEACVRHNAGRARLIR